MNLLFSFLEPKSSHSTLLAGYFSKVVICLLLRKTVPFMHYIQAHKEIIRNVVDLIGITSIMEVLIRLIGADEQMYTNYTETMQWIEDLDVLEMIVDKFSSSDCPEVHANAAETLCSITRFAPAKLSTKISSSSFIGRLFCHALEESRPKSVLINSLCVCISLLDPRRQTLGTYEMYNRPIVHGSTVTANPETVEGMLESLGDLLKLFNVSSAESVLFTTYGKLQPPLGKHRLKIIEFISVLLSVGSEVAEKELIRLGAIHKILDLFFEYPFNNFMHHHVENIIISCLERKNTLLIEHLLRECNLVGKILEAEKNCTLVSIPDKPTVPAEARTSPRIGNIGHLTSISNKLVQMGNNNSEIRAYLQENSEWTDWQTNSLTKRNALENVYQWACGRPTTLQDQTRDSEDDDYQDRDYDVAALANNLSQAFRYGIYSNNDSDETHGSLERDDEDVYFDDESAEVVISSLRLGDDQESGSLFTNSNWFAFEDDKVANECSNGSHTSPSPNTEGTDGINLLGDDDDLLDTATSEVPETKLEDATRNTMFDNLEEVGPSGTDKQPEWVEWRETSDFNVLSDADKPYSVPNGVLEAESKDMSGDIVPDACNPSPSSTEDEVNNEKSAAREPESSDLKPSSSQEPSKSATSKDMDTVVEDNTLEATKDDTKEMVKQTAN